MIEDQEFTIRRSYYSRAYFDGNDDCYNPIFQGNN